MCKWHVYIYMYILQRQRLTATTRPMTQSSQVDRLCCDIEGFRLSNYLNGNLMSQLHAVAIDAEWYHVRDQLWWHVGNCWRTSRTHHKNILHAKHPDNGTWEMTILQYNWCSWSMYYIEIFFKANKRTLPNSIVGVMCGVIDTINHRDDDPTVTLTDQTGNWIISTAMLMCSYSE